LVAAGERKDPFADTSPSRLPSPGVRQVMLHGAREQVTPAALGEAYAEAAAGQSVKVVTVPGAGHFEVITPGATGWTTVLEQIADLSRPPSQQR
jgi:pimeloyl-ACP methyl ester carboxylesterase